MFTYQLDQVEVGDYHWGSGVVIEEYEKSPEKHEVGQPANGRDHVQYQPIPQGQRLEAAGTPVIFSRSLRQGLTKASEDTLARQPQQ